MNGRSNTNAGKQLVAYGALAMILLWLSQPPLRWWPIACIALVPILHAVENAARITRRQYAAFWMVSTAYWLVSLQGLRHAHPAMYACWIALSAYLAVYQVLFVFIVRRMAARGIGLTAAAPIVWVGLECLRNYLLTGISVLMLGHALADVPAAVQIADLFGTYGVSFVIVVANVAVWTLLKLAAGKIQWRESRAGLAVSALVIAFSLAYGVFRVRQSLGNPLATFALIQRDEAIEFDQPVDRELEIFRNYASQSVRSVKAAKRTVDAVVWPESMYSGANPLRLAKEDAVVPPGWQNELTPAELQQIIARERRAFDNRATFVQQAIAVEAKENRRPHLIVGCGVQEFGQTWDRYCGVVSINPDGQVNGWYGKTHLVMFGEYIPIIPWIPGLRSIVPDGMMLSTGSGAQLFEVEGTKVVPNVCIETAVERVTLNQLAVLRSEGRMPDVVVTVTNDGWYDESSVLEHHLRCAQLVAVATRRPILSAANSGPTAWIDSRGAVVQRLKNGTSGAVIATPLRDERVSLYVRIGDWPARMCGFACLLAFGIRSRHATAKGTANDDHEIENSGS